MVSCQRDVDKEKHVEKGVGHQQKNNMDTPLNTGDLTRFPLFLKVYY